MAKEKKAETKKDGEKPKEEIKNNKGHEEGGKPGIKKAEPELKKEAIKKIEKKTYGKKRYGKKEFDKTAWKPRTSIGKKVKNNEITDINEILDNGLNILEPEIVEVLVPNMEYELLLVGQSKGKFGGGQRRSFKQTQKKTAEGNKPRFSTIAVIGNKNGLLGIGRGKSRETVPAREKAIRNAKLNMFKIRRGSGSWHGQSAEPHSVPFTVTGKCGSVSIKLMPAPKGTGLRIEKECAKILQFAGIRDVWSKTFGHTKTKSNLISACEAALRNLMKTKVKPGYDKMLNISEGKIDVPEEKAEKDDDVE